MRIGPLPVWQRLFVQLTQFDGKDSWIVHQFFTIRLLDLLYCKYKDETVGETDAVEIFADNPTVYL